MIRVVLADDQAVVRDGLSLLLSAGGEVEVLAAAADGTEAVERVLELRPDVALLDLRMPGLDGAQVTAALAQQAPEVPVLVLTTFADDDAVLPALRAGAKGYLTKDASGEELLAALRAVAAGRTVLDPGVQARLVELVRGGPISPAATPSDRPEPADAGDTGLTRREVDVVRLVAEGLSNQQIARRLVVSEATVKTHLNHVLSKLDVDGRPGLVAWAWRHGLAT
ncbi:response regulator transcription factor [Jatrophihabitans endophyticus]|uniref:response regulator n=1 Tax=Jatrophihabitans endophyticus TaxID=1206085 RepID=UPI0019E43BA4|nr:response regulator transcription factor [Jatrophihabitans endophyticus]MBE7187535.1 response regulator transcription factor [Jatrophihabitans endophyticus]